MTTLNPSKSPSHKLTLPFTAWILILLFIITIAWYGIQAALIYHNYNHYYQISSPSLSTNEASVIGTRFSVGLPSKYWPRAALLNFCDRPIISVFHVVFFLWWKRWNSFRKITIRHFSIRPSFHQLLPPTSHLRSRLIIDGISNSSNVILSPARPYVASIIFLTLQFRFPLPSTITFTIQQQAFTQLNRNVSSKWFFSHPIR